MKNFLFTSCIATLAAGAASAGGVERSNQSTAILFEKGDVVQVALTSAQADISGVETEFGPTPGAESGNMTPAYLQYSAAYKADINDRVSYALIVDQPYGANVAYSPDTNYYGAGINATLDAEAVTALIKVTSPKHFSVFGGLRQQSLAANAYLPLPGGDSYSANGAEDWGTGWVAGVAWEKPEIAARVALTVNSEIEHELVTNEFGSITYMGASIDFDETNPTPVTTPRSINLEFQTGIAQDTLLFGSVRKVEWGTFEITPFVYEFGSEGESLVQFPGDTVTYNLGIGRRITDRFSVALNGSYEAPYGGFTSNLGPVDGRTSYGIAATYDMDRVQVAGGIQFVDMGDAQTSLDSTNPTADFTGNSGLGAGIRVTFKLP